MRSLFYSVLLAASLAKVYAAIGPVADLQIVNANIAPDGFTRSAVLANGQLPGPLITANKGEDFVLNVADELTDSSMDLVTSIHWHGIFQLDTNYVDGGAFVNQCPIVPGKSFPYRFNAREQTGTYWYHSHFQAQYCDGLRGALVIYDPDDPQRTLYDVDNENTVITLVDWYHYSSLQAPLVAIYNSTLINGKGRYLGGPASDLAVVNVQRGIRYRMRLVSISCDPAYNFSIDGHQMSVIEVDGNNVQPLQVDSLEIFAGQRYSVVLIANQAIGNYWIRALPNFGDPDPTYTNFTNVAILHYLGAQNRNPSNDSNVNVPGSRLPLVETNLHPLDPTPVPGNPTPGGADTNILLDVTLSDDFTKFLINGTSFESPTVPVLLQILNGVPASQLLPNGSIYPLERNKSVEISIPAGAAGGPHPIHLHGHAFHVVRSAGNATYNYDDPVIRDVVSIGDNGDNVTIRFQTDNPGPWFLHCHIDWHLEKGFAVVMAEEVAEVSANVHPSPEWDNLCPAYNDFANVSE